MRWLLLACPMLVLVLAPACDNDDVLNPPVWMSIAPLQCGNNAWDRAGSPVDAYYESLGVTIHAVEIERVAFDVCESCACPTGERLDVLVDTGAVPFMIGEGFVLREDWAFDPFP